MADWQVYIVECADGSLYTGITRDVTARINSHNKGTGAKYTRSRLPVELRYQEDATDRTCAAQREYAIKQLPRTAKLQLINQLNN